MPNRFPKNGCKTKVNYIQKKAWESSCHSSHVLRLWHRLFVETSNAEAHADMYNDTTLP